MRRPSFNLLGRGRRDPASEAAAQSDRFRLQVLPHLDAAYRYARSLSRDREDAEDTVQDAMLRAFRSYATCRGQEKAWLLAIVRNCHHDLTSGRARARGRPDPADAEHDVDTPESLLERKSAAERVRDCIRALPEPFREALVLREIEGLSYREIADVAQIPIGTVMSRLARARDILATGLSAERDDQALGRSAP